jgi:C-methyltransferase C-terminal domain/Putative zinc binding domain/Methyltransferase domain
VPQMETYSELSACRVSGSDHFVPVLNLGHQVLTGIFPKAADDVVTRGPLELVWCPDSGLLQLRHTYDSAEMYGANYGYRSGLNQSMVDHLSSKVKYLERIVPLRSGDVVLDVGSNDGTTLRAYSVPGINRIGIDPTGEKFKQYYSAETRMVPEFFSAKAYRSAESQSARIVTSIAMLYDLDSPVEFARQIAEVLARDGIWHFEQSYMPSMLRMNSYDTICHEHLEYYSLGVIERILDRADLQLVDVVTNAVNGGSFAVTATHRANKTIRPNRTVIEWLLQQEDRMGLGTPKPYREFEERVFRHREDLVRLVRALNADGKRILGYGASTKGNVMLQFCGFTIRDVAAIADVNPDKFGCVTPGTHIPIVSESDAKAMSPDYFLVLPWHFKEGILRREKEFLRQGGKFIFPFPEIEIV